MNSPSPGLVALAEGSSGFGSDERAGAGRIPPLPSSGAGLGARVARQQSPILPTGKQRYAQPGVLVKVIFGQEGDKTLPPTFDAVFLAVSRAGRKGGGGCWAC